MTQQAIGPSAAELGDLYASLAIPLARIGLRIGETDPDFVAVAKALERLTELLNARALAERQG